MNRRQFIYSAVVLGSVAALFARPPLGWAATLNVPNGGNFQAALDSALPGDTIVLQAGGRFPTNGGFILRNKGNSTQMITIQSSALASLPAAGYRVHPSDAPNMPKLVSTADGSGVIAAEMGANHYTFIGVEFTVDPGIWSYAIVRFGEGTETTLAQLPHDLVVDRCYVHGDPTAQPGTKRGIQLDGGNTSILNSYISEIHVIGQDSQALGGFNGSGPFKIINNYLEASTENLLFGGSDPAIPNLIPSDIEIRYNYLSKPLSWLASDPSYAGLFWAVKNIFELKNAQRVIVDGNIFENSWAQGQDGFGIVLTPRNQDGACPWCIVKDVTFTHNIVRHVASAFNLLSEDDTNPSGTLQTIIIKDNLVDDINPAKFGQQLCANCGTSDGRILQFTYSRAPAYNVTFDHNTAFHTSPGNSFAAVGDCCTVANGFNYTNSIVTHGTYGFFGSGGGGQGTSALNTYFTNWLMTKNAIIGGGVPSAYPTGNFFPADTTAVSFVNYSGGDYHLAAGSPYKNAGTDGKDVGADIDAIQAATCGTVPGIPTSACSTYVPPPIPPPSGTSLPAPTLNLPPYLRVNSQIQASEPSQYRVASYSWVISPVSAASTRSGSSSLNAGAGSANFSTASGTADLAPRGLVPGTYRILVTATDTIGNVSPSSQANVTLVSADLSGVRVFPNPWRSDRHAALPITFDRLSLNSSIKLFTVSGHWVKTLPTSSTSVTWDLTDDNGDKVASGLYLYLIKADQDQKKTGQIAIIH